MAVESGIISAALPFTEDSFQPATLELRLGEVAYRLRAVFPPNLHRPIQASVDALAEHSLRLDVAGGAILENNHIYLIPLLEQLDLPPQIRGRASPKSSTGRLDIFVRLLAERTNKFDDVPAGYSGRLYALVMPRSFAIVVNTGTTLSQLRLLTTAPGAMVRDDELPTYWSEHPLLYRLRSQSETPRPIGYERAHVEEGLFLTADFLRPPNAPLAYTPRRDGAVIDLQRKAHYDVSLFWEPVLATDEPNVIRLHTDGFYLLRCQELLSIPPTLAAEMLPYDVQLGELRSHYAGFFDPGFGYDPSGQILGTPAILEIRAREPFVMRHGHTLCRLQFYRMAARPDISYGDPILLSSYQRQRFPFSKHFIVNASGRSAGARTEHQHEFDFAF